MVTYMALWVLAPTIPTTISTLHLTLMWIVSKILYLVKDILIVIVSYAQYPSWVAFILNIGTFVLLFVCTFS